MPGRSPHRRLSPPPPHISRHSPARGRRSPERHHLEVAHSRSHDRREYRVSVRRSRSPTTKRRSFSPPVKRKASPSREREIARRSKVSKSPVDARSLDRAVYSSTETESIIRNVASYERLRGKESEGAGGRDHSQFRGPEGLLNFEDKHSLKKFTIEIVRKPSSPHNDNRINRSIPDPDEIVPVRRPGMRGRTSLRGQFVTRHTPSPQWLMNERTNGPFKSQNEGTRPLFLQAAISASSNKSAPHEEYKRIININTKVPDKGEQDRSRERVRYSPGPYEDSRRTYYHERRESSPYESHRSPHREKYDTSEKIHLRRDESKEEIRVTDGRKHEERRYSPRRKSYERESDLRIRINEKRIDSNVRSGDREHSSRRFEVERDRPSRSHHSPPRERRRTGSNDRHEGSRSREAWEREREGEKKRRARSHEREERGRDRDRYERSEHYEGSNKSRRTQPYKTDYESKKFHKTYEETEFVPPPIRGRGIFPIHRGIPPMIRGRGIPPVPSRGFRGGMIGRIPRGVPRAPFLGMRGFPPRKSTY